MAKQIVVGNIKLSWHPRNGKWRKIIGRTWNRDYSRLVPKQFYFGPDTATAAQEAADKINEWRDLVANWDTQYRRGARLAYPDGIDLSHPFWLDLLENDDQQATDEADSTSTEVIERQPDTITVKRAREKYFESQEARLKLMGKRRLKQGTLNTIRATLNVALGAIDDETGMRILPDDRIIDRIGYTDVQELINYHYREDGVEERTALNYCRAIKSWLDWMDAQPDMSFSKPKGVDALFKLGRPEVHPYIPSVKDVAQVVHACKNDRELLYVMLAINCGFTTVDISNLVPGEFIQHNGAWCIWRRRDKTSHQNSFNTLHQLFEETATLIERERAPDNPHKVLFLNKEGNPLLVVEDGYKTRTIADSWEGIRKRAGVGDQFKFKSLRKFGATWIQNTTHQDNMARMYLSQKVPGVLRSYVKDDFAQLSDVLVQFRKALKAAGALPHIQT